MEPTVRRDTMRQPDAFREAAAVNAGGDKAKPRKPSIIERMTGLARRQPAEPAAPASRPMPTLKPSAPAAEAQARPAAVPAAPQPAAPAIPAARPAATRSPALGGLEPTDRPAQARTEDDLLDIPAFLRRQAN